MVTSFRYLGRVILAADYNWTEVVRNLTKTRAMWRRMKIIFIREGAEPRVYDFLFKTIVKSVLLFGAETWVVTPRMGWILGGFQDQVTWRLTGRLLERQADGKWDYTLEEAERVEAGFDTMKA